MKIYFTPKIVTAVALSLITLVACQEESPVDPCKRILENIDELEKDLDNARDDFDDDPSVSNRQALIRVIEDYLEELDKGDDSKCSDLYEDEYGLSIRESTEELELELQELNISIPDNLIASNDFALKIVLEWDEAFNAEGYNIYRAIKTGSNPETLSYTMIGTTIETTFEDISVESNSSYYYKVKAYNDDGESDFTKAVPGVTISLTADEAFSALAEYTAGKRYDAGSADEVPNIIIEIIAAQATSNTDLVFLIDNTASMADDISAVKSSLTNIISKLPSGTRLAMAVYNDANVDPTGWYKWFDLTTNFSLAQSFLNDIDVYGGGDAPESVYDGIYLTTERLSWASTSKRMIIVIGDAPPLEGTRTTYSLKQVVDKCLSLSIDVNLYPILID